MVLSFLLHVIVHRHPCMCSAIRVTLMSGSSRTQGLFPLFPVHFLARLIHHLPCTSDLTQLHLRRLHEFMLWCGVRTDIKHGRILEVVPTTRMQNSEANPRPERGAETGDETKMLSTSSRIGVGCPPEATSVALARPLLKFQEASEAVHVEACVGRNKGFCGTGRDGGARVPECPNWIISSPGRGKLCGGLSQVGLPGRRCGFSRVHFAVKDS